jgi:type I restriction enzyme S subunit
MITEASEYITEDAYSNSSARWVPEGALVMALAGQGKTKGMVAQLAIRATCNQSMAAIVPATEINPRYLYWWLDAQYQNIRNLAGGDLRDGLNLDLLGRIPCPLPAEDEQSSIATFLDSETAKIDALAAEQERLIGLLKEKRQGVIWQAITKGLEPNVPMKDSGVEWLGLIPSHWSSSRFKWQIDRNDGGVWGDDPDGEEDTIVLRSTEQTVDGHWRMDNPAARKLSKSERAAALLVEGDLVVTKSSGSSLHIGKTTIVTTEIAAAGCCYSNFMQRVRTRSSFLPKLAWYVMNNELARLQFDLASNSTTGLANLNGTMIGAIVLAVPPLDEQERIASFLLSECEQIDGLISEADLAITLLAERRLSLVSAAVTGKVDVRKLEVV